MYNRITLKRGEIDKTSKLYSYTEQRTTQWTGRRKRPAWKKETKNRTTCIGDGTLARPVSIQLNMFIRGGNILAR